MTGEGAAPLTEKASLVARLAEVLYDATTGADRPDVPWGQAVQGLWLADAESVLDAYRVDYLDLISPPVQQGGSSDA